MVNQDIGGQRPGLKEFLEEVPSLIPIVWPVHSVCFDEGSDHTFILAAETNQNKGILLHFLAEPSQGRKRGPTRCTPGGLKVQKYHLALQIFRGEVLSVQCHHRKIRCRWLNRSAWIFQYGSGSVCRRTLGIIIYELL